MPFKNLVARRYAKALFQASQKTGVLDKTGRFLEQLSQIFTSKRLHHVFLNPTCPQDALRGCVGIFLEKANAPHTIQRFCDVLIQEKRVILIKEINSCFQNFLRRSKGESIVQVWSASPLSQNICQELTNVLSQAFNQKMSLEMHQNPDLLSGFILETQGVQLDASMLTHLNQLTSSIKKDSRKI